MKEYISILKKCDIFEGVNEKVILDIIQKSHVETFEKDSTIKHRNDPCDEILILIEGETLGLFVNYDGKVIQVDHMFAPKVLAAAVIFSTNPKYPVDVVTVTKSKILKISKNIFIQKMLENEKLLKNYLKVVSDAFTFITDRFYEITLKNLVQKICSYLFDLYEKEKKLVVTLEMTKEELAREFGVTRPALSRAFIELEKNGIIELNGKYVKLKNLQYIEDYAKFF